MTELHGNLDQVVERLRRDVAATVGPAHEATVLAQAAHVREFAAETARDHPDEPPDSADLGQRVVDNVQEEFHDLWVDTTWPACQRHPNHPLWYRDGQWWCETDGVAIASLGNLPARQAAG
jgi:hypothetical protein